MRSFVILAKSAATAVGLIMATHFAAAVDVPNLRTPGVIDQLKANAIPGLHPFSETYNLGATGLRGWIYIDGDDAGYHGVITDKSREILVTVASTPGSATIAVDDVILGAKGGNSGEVPYFTKDSRKALVVSKV